MSTRVQAVRWKIARRHLARRRPRRLRWVLLVVLVMTLVSGGAGTAAGFYFASQLPPASRFQVHFPFQDARFYDSRGNLLYNMADLSKNRGKRVVEPLQGRFDTGNACRGGINRIPTLLQNATIATEDATFYTNPGFDPLSIARAAYQDFTYGHIVSGASTITQQLVRANMLNDARTITRKAQEVALAYEISHRFSKRKILWYYLNSVPYGNLAYGAQAAAEVYFDEPVCRLDLAQAALLAGLPRAPSYYDPVIHRAAAFARMREVLQLMHRHGYLPRRAAIVNAMHEAQRWTFHALSAPMRYPAFVQYAIDQIQGMPRVRSQLFHGVDIYTTIEPRLQNLAQSLVTQQIDGLTLQHVTDGALVSLDLRPQRYGWILSMVGSAHYTDKAGQVNMAISPRQPGSSMKPFNYIWAFTNGHVYPGTWVVDSPIRLPDPGDAKDHGWYLPTNYDQQFHGMLTIREALSNSLNIPAVKTEFYVTGPAHVAQTAYRFGMKSLYKDNPGLGCQYCYAVTLGGLERGTRLLEETAAYGVFATGGQTVPPIAIWKVVKRSTGQVIYCSSSCPRGVQPARSLASQRQRVVDAAHAYMMTDVLSDNSARCTPRVCEFGLISPLLLSRPAAAKTGTTNAWTDNWTVGYTPQIVTGVWAGNADRSPMINVIGITGAAPVWHDFMEGAFKILNLPVEPFVAPSNVIRTDQCVQPGSAYPGIGVSDVYVASAPGAKPNYPMCALPERGYQPLPCYSVFPGQYFPPPGVAPGDCIYVPPTPGPLTPQAPYAYTSPFYQPTPAFQPYVPAPQPQPPAPPAAQQPGPAIPQGTLPPE